MQKLIDGYMHLQSGLVVFLLKSVVPKGTQKYVCVGSEANEVALVTGIIYVKL